MLILGINLGHDSSAALIKDGQILAAAAEERFVQIKHYGGPPFKSLDYCLKAGKAKIEDIDAVAFCGPLWKPDLRLLFGLKESQIRNIVLSEEARKRPLSLVTRAKRRIMKRFYSNYELPGYFRWHQLPTNTPITLVDHHTAHAASAYYGSANQYKTLIITSDGVGDGVSISLSLGDKGKIIPIRRYGTNSSLGWFYGLVTESLGWWVGDGEGKTMGLAAYGDPYKFNDQLLAKYLPRFYQWEPIQTVDFGRIKFFPYCDTLHWHFPQVNEIRGLALKYEPENLAAKAQYLLEQEMTQLVRLWAEYTGLKKVAAAGGTFLNVKMNQKIVESGFLNDFFIFPDAGDSGLAVGSGLWLYHEMTGNCLKNRISHLYWGPEFSDQEVEKILRDRGLQFLRTKDIATEVAERLVQKKIVGWFQGRMECGPRALGGRSILFDPRYQEHKDIINSRVKFREPFRPFCPPLTLESAQTYLESAQRIERFMISSYRVKKEKRQEIPAVTHKDGTARPQFVEKALNPLFWQVIDNFGKRTGVSVLLNTSFNIKGQPIVCTPRDALKCFFDTGIDSLAIGGFLLDKNG